MKEIENIKEKIKDLSPKDLLIHLKSISLNEQIKTIILIVDGIMYDGISDEGLNEFNMNEYVKMLKDKDLLNIMKITQKEIIVLEEIDEENSSEENYKIMFDYIDKNY